MSADMNHMVLHHLNSFVTFLEQNLQTILRTRQTIKIVKLKKMSESEENTEGRKEERDRHCF